MDRPVDASAPPPQGESPSHIMKKSLSGLTAPIFIYMSRRRDFFAQSEALSCFHLLRYFF